MMFQSRNPDLWVKVKSDGITYEKKSNNFNKIFEKHNSYNLSHTLYDFSENGGIYTKKQLKQTRDCINYRDTKKARDSMVYFGQTGGKALSHSEVKMGDGWSI